MKYFKNVDLVQNYIVSDKAVRNWIVSAQEGKLDLHLHQLGNKHYIIDDLHNKAVLDGLVIRSQKYKNKRSRLELKPTKEFYTLFDRHQIIEIIEELDCRRILPMKYKYFGEGADYWNKYLHELVSAGQRNLITNTIEALGLELSHLDMVTATYPNVNIVNLCVGSCNMLKETLCHFKEQEKLRRFVAIDISESMLSFSEKNINEWFGGKLLTEKYVRDLGFERFRDILARDSFGLDAKETVNLLFLVGGPLVNFKNPQELLSTIYNSMGKNDYLTITLKRDTERTRRFFDFNLKKDESLLSLHDGLLLKLLNIEPSYYELEQSFDEKSKLRTMAAILRKDLSIAFELSNFKKKINLKKGDRLPVWWSWHHSDEDIIARLTTAGFDIQSILKSSDNQLICLTVKRQEKTNDQSL